MAAELRNRREPAGEAITARLAEADQAIAERKAELERYLTLYGRGTIPVEQLDAKAEEVRGALAALEVYRTGLVEEQQRTDLLERHIAGVVEALAAFQEHLGSGPCFEDRYAVVKMLVKGIVIETRTDDAGVLYPVAHIKYRFEQPDTAEIPIPLELEPLFASTEVAENWQIRSSVILNSPPSPLELEREVKL